MKTIRHFLISTLIMGTFSLPVWSSVDGYKLDNGKTIEAEAALAAGAVAKTIKTDTPPSRTKLKAAAREIVDCDNKDDPNTSCVSQEEKVEQVKSDGESKAASRE